MIILIVAKFACVLCGKGSPSESDLVNHIKAEHHNQIFGEVVKKDDAEKPKSEKMETSNFSGKFNLMTNGGCFLLAYANTPWEVGFREDTDYSALLNSVPPQGFP